MAIRYEIEMDALFEAYKRGLADGRVDGERDMQARLVGRLQQFRRERSNVHDVGGPVLDEAIARCSATVADVTPEGVGRG